jgi:serine/threonine protein kinase
MNLSVGNYQLLTEIGSGGLCKVYKCTSTNGNLYALKKIKMQYWGNPVLFECMILSSFNCPYLMKAEEIIIDSNINIIMELAKEDFCSYLKINELKVPILMEYIYHLMLALDCLHKSGIIHGDVKAKNILLMKNGKIKLSDFNLSRYAAIPTSKSGYTITHKSPEVWKEEKWNIAADIWALGCTIFEMATRTTLFPSVVKETTSRAECGSRMQAGIYKFLIEMRNEKYDINKYKNGKYTPFPSFLYNPEYSPILNMLDKCLVYDPINRPFIEDLLNTYYGTGSIFYGPLTTPKFELSNEIVDYILNMKTSHEVKVAIRHLLYKLPPTFHNIETIRVIISLISKLFLSSDVVITKNKIINDENELCKRLVFNLYFKL